jgi:hypothetical protein
MLLPAVITLDMRQRYNHCMNNPTPATSTNKIIIINNLMNICTAASTMS